MDRKELLAAIAAEIGSDKQKAIDFAEELRTHSPDTKEVSQHLINIGNRGKDAELGGKIKKLEGDLKTATDTIAVKDGEIQELTNKAPDAGKIEERVKGKLEPLIAAEKLKREAAEKIAKDLRRERFRDKLEAQFKTADDSGVVVGDDDDDLVRKALVDDYMDRYVETEDGKEQVLQLESALPYDGKTIDDQIKALNRDIRKKVPSKYLITRTDTGSGVGAAGNGGKGGWKEFRHDIEEQRDNEADAAPTASERLRGVRTPRQRSDSDKKGRPTAR